MNSLTRRAFRDSIPVLCGYMVLGIGFGMVLTDAGYALWTAVAMSVFIYAGSMQYVGTSLMASGASIPTFFLMTLMVNARHLFYGISMIVKYSGMGKKKPYLIFALTDETYSLVCRDPEGIEKKDLGRYYLLVSAMNQSYWVTGSILGCLIAKMSMFSSEGVDFSLTALFITVATGQWIDEKDHFPALVGIAASIICLLLFGKDTFLIPTMVLITAALLLRKYVKERK